jgi:hypothetical protein
MLQRDRVIPAFPRAPNLAALLRKCSCVSAINSNGRTIWIADAHRDDAMLDDLDVILDVDLL